MKLAVIPFHLMDNRTMREMPKKTRSTITKKKSTGKDKQFPLAAYIEVYDWIGNWAEVASDPELHLIAQSAFVSLTAVGVLMRDVMRQMGAEIETSHASKKTR
jgi:hypothetical protein